MTEYNRFIFSGTLVQLNIFQLRLIRASADAWFAQTKSLNELSSPFPAVYFSFATIFQYLSFVRFRSYSKLRFFLECNLQSSKSFVDIFFRFWEISKQTLGNIKKTALILSSESVNMLIRRVVTAVRVVRINSRSTSIVFLLYS